MPFPADPQQQELIDDARGGDHYALARLVTEVEAGHERGRAALASLYANTGKAFTTAVTGAPGVGKSTIVDGVVAEIRRRETTVAVIAVDPSSPFSGGAILGDRIRMLDHSGDPGVYIRSMASRGQLGGLAEGVPRVTALLDGLGFPEILIETVGVGQGEVEVAAAADTTVVVVTAGWGDGIQASKAGILEIADILAVNKAELGGAEETVRDLEQMLDFGAELAWRPPVMSMVAIEGEGVEELWAAVLDHRAYLSSSGGLTERRRSRLRHELRTAVSLRLQQAVDEQRIDARSDGILADVLARRLDPWSAAGRIIGAAAVE